MNAQLLQEAVNPTYLLAWIPETLLHERGSNEWDKFVKIEEKAPIDDEDDGELHWYDCIQFDLMGCRCRPHRPPDTATRVLCILRPLDLNIFSGPLPAILLVLACVVGSILFFNVNLNSSRWLCRNQPHQRRHTSYLVFSRR